LPTSETDSGGREVEPDFEAFCVCLNRHQVDFVIVGSEAVAVHGAPRYSQDFDTFIRATRDNAERVVAALEEFGVGAPAHQLDIDAGSLGGARWSWGCLRSRSTS
jgi:hypothetical protein